MSADRPGKGLGMGLQALLGEAARPAGADSPPSSGGVREVEIARIRPNPNQPRIRFDEEALKELADSIAERGVLQPILLRPEYRYGAHELAFLTSRERPEPLKRTGDTESMIAAADACHGDCSVHATLSHVAEITTTWDVSETGVDHE